MKKKNCVCGNYFCISGNPKYKCDRCKKDVCNMLKIDCNIDKKTYCIGCYILSFSDSLDRKKKKLTKTQKEAYILLDKKRLLNRG